MGLMRKPAYLLAFALSLAALSGCGGKKQARIAPPMPPPEIQPGQHGRETVALPPTVSLPPNAKPIYSEVGIASWYGPPYHKRNAANGEPFDMNVPSAAHKTLPLNSIVRVTNLSNGKTIVLRITDRGPFVGDRMLDLSMGAAKEIGVYHTGLAKVRLDVLQTPVPIDHGGRWCVQIGAFSDYDAAAELKSKLLRKYHTAKVIQFSGPTGEWVRIRPQDDDKSRAVEVAKQTHVSEGGVFLVRLD